MGKQQHTPGIDNKGLQRFTDFEDKMIWLLSFPKMKTEHLEHFNDEEREELNGRLAEIFNELTGVERERFTDKIEDILSDRNKNEVWELNNIQITFAISKLMRESGRMPTKQDIAKEARLSRVTVHKHLKNFKAHPYYAEHMEKFQFMAPKLLSEVFRLAASGDIRAARLYFEVVGSLGGNNLTPPVKQQNNYIQLNSITISQDTVKQLQPEQINQIELILKEAVRKTPVL